MSVDKKRIVVALGGNALGDNLKEQMDAVKVAAQAIVDLVEEGHDLVLVHGNGPQVGMIETAFETAAKHDSSFSVLPMSVCVALSQGYIGYDLQNAIRMELDRRDNTKPVATIVTQTIVDPDDPAFSRPSKPIGTFLSKEEADKLTSEGVAVMEDSGRGYRRVVASPKPIGMVETPIIEALLEAEQLPIAAGGGGIPVALKDGQYRGQSAIVDKDWAAATLAEGIHADLLIILTAVEKVCIDFGKPSQQELSTITIKQAQDYMAEGQFGVGSMEPKIAAAVSFAQSGTEREALITSLTRAVDGINGHTGTKIVK